MQEPLRMDDLDSSGFLSVQATEIPFPLLYPSELSFFNLLDSASPQFQSLETLEKLPVQNKFPAPKSDPIRYLRKSQQSDLSNSNSLQD